MRILRDYRCAEGHITERFIDDSTELVECKTCSKPAHKTLGFGTIILDGTDPSFPGAYEKWATVREKRHRQLNEKKRRDGG